MFGRAPTFLAGGMAPLAVQWFFISVFHCRAEVYAWTLLKVEIWVAGFALPFWWSIATFAVFRASLAHSVIDPETKRALRDTGNVSWVIERQKVEIGFTNNTISETWTLNASWITFSASSTLIMLEKSNRTYHITSTHKEIGICSWRTIWVVRRTWGTILIMPEASQTHCWARLAIKIAWRRVRHKLTQGTSIFHTQFGVRVEGEPRLAYVTTSIK